MLFEETRGNRAKCPRSHPPETCTKEYKDYCVQLYPDSAHCFRCEHTWNLKEKEYNGSLPSEFVPHNTRSNVELLIKSGFAKGRIAFLDHFDIVVSELDLPWSRNALSDDLMIGVRNNEDTPQLMFMISEDHIKWHKSKQFGNASNKIYPMSSLFNADPGQILIICEGEKDAVTLNVNGINAITFTAGAGAVPEDIRPIKNMNNIAVCFDADEKGDEGAKKVVKALLTQNSQRRIRIVQFQNKPNRYDITDYFNDGGDRSSFIHLCDSAHDVGDDPGAVGGLSEVSLAKYMAREGKVEHVVDEILIKGGTSCIAGGSNVGKSILSLQFAMSVAAGIPFLNFQVPKARKVLVAQFEMMPEQYRERLVSQYEAVSRRYPEKLETLKKNLTLIDEKRKKLFVDTYDEIETNLFLHRTNTGIYDGRPVEVVVIDNMYTTTDKNINDNNDLKNLLGRIRTIGVDHNVAWMLVAHHKKMNGELRALDHDMISGGKTFVNFLDNCVQMSDTAASQDLKIVKITKVRTNSDFHSQPIGVKFVDNDEQLYLKNIGVLPKNEEFWYKRMKESEEDSVINNIKTEGDNFTYKDLADSLAEKRGITSTTTVTRFANKLVKHGRIKKIKRDHYVIVRSEYERFL